MIYVTLPDNFIALDYPGYFWNLDDEKLYSLKVNGILKELKLRMPNYYARWDEPYYSLSVNGKIRNIGISKLRKLVAKHTKIPVASQLASI